MQITRKTARRVRSVFRRALDWRRRDEQQPITLLQAADGLALRAGGPNAAIEYRLPDGGPVQQIVVPFELLGHCEGGRDDPVELQTEGNETIVSWTHNAVPQRARYPNQPAQPFPECNPEMRGCPRRLLAGIHQASLSAATESERYALHCLQLAQDGRIVATDSHQFYMEEGFDFPWSEDVFVRRTTLFGLREFEDIEQVAIGTGNGWLRIDCGPWSLLLRIEADARYPDVRRLLPARDSIQTTARIADTDCDFLTARLGGLPCEDATAKPVTLDLNGAVLIRSCDENSACELRLSNSSADGPPLRLATNRKLLERALRLGFREIGFSGDVSPVVCCNGQRTFMWSPLSSATVIGPRPDADQIESDRCDPITPSPATSPDQPPPKADPSSSAPGDTVDELLSQADILRSQLREAGKTVGQLVVALRQHRKRSRTVHTALASLRELDGLSV